MLMQFSDTPFPPSTQLFAPRDEVLQYLEHYAKELVPMLRFNQEVVEVKPSEANGHRWSLATRHNGQGNVSTKLYDAVVVASGHCDRPSLPDIEGLDEWAQRYPESLVHSLSYRNVEPFRNKVSPSHFYFDCSLKVLTTHRSQRVLLVGGGPSGADIGHQIAQVCKYPMIASRPRASPYHMEEPNEVEVPNLVRLISDNDQRAAIFEDGTVEQDIDIVFLCTGYAYEFPFLQSVYPTVADDGIHAIHPYQYMFDITNPTLAFVEMLEQIVPFGLAESQAAVIARVWSGRLTLPSRDGMNTWVEDIVRQRGKGRSFYAVTPPLDLAYMREMYNWSQRAERGENDTIGRTARQWDDHFCWLRMAAAAMKKAFVAKGADRANIKRYEELGFEYNGTRYVF